MVLWRTFWLIFPKRMSAALGAIASLQAQTVAHGRVCILIEASAASGSSHLPAHLEALQDRIGNPSLVVCLDGGCGDFERLWLSSSMRGALNATLRLQPAEQPPASREEVTRAAQLLLGRVADPRTGRVRDFGGR